MKILFISRVFPPRNSPQAIQMGRLVNALANNGHHVSVVSQVDSLSKMDINSISDKHFQFDVFYVQGERKIYEGVNIKDRIKAMLYEELESINSISQWVKNAVSVSTNVIKDSNPDVVLSAALPFENHLVGLEIKKKLNTLWMAYFSDPWPNAPYPYNRKTIPLIKSYKFKLLRTILKKCDAVIMPNKIQIDYIQELSGVNISPKSYIVPHIGAELKDAMRRPEYSNCLTHTGHLSKERTSLPLLKALKRLKNENINSYLDRLILVGNVCAQFKEMIESTATNTMVKCLGTVSNKESSVIAASSKVLLIIEANMKTNPFIPSKIADYTMTGRPILAITSEKSTVRDYFKKYSGGIAVSNDEGEIYDALKVLFVSKDLTQVNKTYNSSKLAVQFKETTVAAKFNEIFRNIIPKV